MGNNIERQKLLRKIFVYHNLPLSDVDGLKDVWLSDLYRFSNEEIENAWDKWRMDDFNQRRKPTPFDLIKLINKKTEIKSSGIENNVLIKGKSYITDLIIDDLEKMDRNLPGWKERMKESQFPYEKLMIGFAALDVPLERKNYLMSMVRKISPNLGV